MPSRRVAVDLNAGTYYLTLTIQRWYYLFDRHNRWQILAESLRYCQEHKGLELNGYVFMLNYTAVGRLALFKLSPLCARGAMSRRLGWLFDARANP